MAALFPRPGTPLPKVRRARPRRQRAAASVQRPRAPIRHSRRPGPLVPLARAPLARVLLLLAPLAAAACASIARETAPPEHPPGTVISAPGQPIVPGEPAAALAPAKWYDNRGWAERTLASLSLEDKASQMMMPILLGGFAPVGSRAHARAQEIVKDHAVGGVIISVGSPTEVAAKLNWMQSMADLPLLIASDLEGGAGFRFGGVLHAPTNIGLGGATRFPSLMAVGAAGEPGLAYEMGRVTALEARAIGVHVAFAPVLDVNNNPDNPVINVRSLGEDPERVAELGAAFVRGVQDHGAIATAKHFPGHGDTSIDSHLALPVIRVTRERMDSVELPPFQRAIDAGVGGVMTAHVAVPEITGARTPATLERSVLTDMLRAQMGFGGLVFTDAMDMSAVDAGFERGEAAVRAVEAGADVILMPPDIAAARAGIVGAVRSGRLSEERVDASVLRILRSKERLGLDRARTVDVAAVPEVVGIRPHLSIAREVAGRSVTALKDERGLLPLHGTPGARVYSVVYRRPNDIRAGRAFNARLGQTYRRLRTAFVDAGTSEDEFARVLARARSMQLTVVSLHVAVRTASGTVALPDDAVDFVAALARSGTPHIVVAFGNPYLLDEFPEVQTYVAAWSGVPVSETAVAEAILGEFPVTGRTPARISGMEIGSGLQIPARPGR